MNTSSDDKVPPSGEEESSAELLRVVFDLANERVGRIPDTEVQERLRQFLDSRRHIGGELGTATPARRLAGRLRDLREQEHLTLRQLAKVLGGADPLSIATVSLWEKPGTRRLPPPQRLAAYARLFCTDRSFNPAGLRLLRDEDLTEQERQKETELYEELLALRDRELRDHARPAGKALSASVQRSSIRHFPGGEAVSVASSGAPSPQPNADLWHPNFSQYARHADLDALIEAFGQIKADNPARMIRLLPPGELTRDFALNHLVIIGGAAISDTAPWFDQGIPLPDIPLPVTRLIGTTHAFICDLAGKSREFAAKMDDQGSLIEDVGLIARGPHPDIPQRTVTILSGITSRGVHGAALSLIDSRVRDANEHYLHDRFGEDEAFCILMRVLVQQNTALPPNLSNEDIRLYEWSGAEGNYY